MAGGSSRLSGRFELSDVQRKAYSAACLQSPVTVTTARTTAAATAAATASAAAMKKAS